MKKFGYKKILLRNAVRGMAAVLLAGCMLLFSGCEEKPDPLAIRDQAVALFQQGDYQGASDKFGEALDASRGQVSELQYDILKYRAECELRLGQYKTAKESYEALLQLDDVQEDQDEYNSILTELGALDTIAEAKAYFDNAEYKHAYDALEPFSALDGSLAGKTAWYNQAVCQEYMGNFEEAYKMLQEYTLMYPDEDAARKEQEFCRSRSVTSETAAE